MEAITTVAGNVAVDLATAEPLPHPRRRPPRAPRRGGPGRRAPLRRDLRHRAATSTATTASATSDAVAEADGRPRYPAPDAVLETLDGARSDSRHARTASESDLVVVALGPLTNLATALAARPRCLAALGRIVVMGGAVGAPGNVTPAAEFNFYVDPEAAAEVFEADLPDRAGAARCHPPGRAHRGRSRRAARPAPAPRVARFIDDFTRARLRVRRRAGDGASPCTTRSPSASRSIRRSSACEPLHVRGRVATGESRAGMSRRRPPRRPARADARRPNCRVALTVDATALPPLFLDRAVPRICVVGSANVDFTRRPAAAARARARRCPGGTLLVNLGGKGANQAVAARLLGAEVRLVGCVGDDGVRRRRPRGLAGRGIGVDGLDRAWMARRRAPR